ncbi:Putative NAD(P)-binding domain superfamily [Colletotrichum destructivum]|uniref:NAD(P)-binding domain superfamily n=1 Tax=Colletotrichum destructivum TaxID=34406 RepID=A0AAX4IWU0_9PEZI|nr:Putative NAD(P)-binding domain superfamily [Colletotrichum destructivum]
MSADDQQFLDVLSSLPNHIRRYSDDLANLINPHVDKAAQAVRETLASTEWLPDSVRPSPPVRHVPIEVIAMSRYETIHTWVKEHKLLTGAVVAVVGFVAYRSYRSSRFCKKTRRAKRARNGGRLEVVVIAGSPSLPLTRSLSLDFERRGFIVYIVCNAEEDESMVHSLSRPDILPLTIDTTDPPKAGAAIDSFAQYLQSPHAPAPRTRPNHLQLKSVILIPSLNYQTSPIATIPPSSFADLFNTHLLHPILTIQAFLPLLTTRLSPPGEKWTPPKVLVFTPSIISSINPPFHAPEATVSSALSAFTEVLTAELRPLGIPVTHMQLGTFDFTGFQPAKHTHPSQRGLLEGGPGIDADATETLMWPENARHAYGRNFVMQSTSAISAGRIRGLKGSSLRHLHNAVFDVIDGSITSGTVRVGLGASVYGFVGRWVPRGLVSWMMGIRRVDELSAWQTSSYNGSLDGSENEDGQDFVAVPDEKLDSNVWKSS